MIVSINHSLPALAPGKYLNPEDLVRLLLSLEPFEVDITLEGYSPGVIMRFPSQGKINLERATTFSQGKCPPDSVLAAVEPLSPIGEEWFFDNQWNLTCASQRNTKELAHALGVELTPVVKVTSLSQFGWEVLRRTVKQVSVVYIGNRVVRLLGTSTFGVSVAAICTLSYQGMVEIAYADVDDLVPVTWFFLGEAACRDKEPISLFKANFFNYHYHRVQELCQSFVGHTTAPAGGSHVVL